MSIFCKHDWSVLSETVTKSALEHTCDLGAEIESGSESLLNRKHIQVFTCSKCGKLERFVEEL